MDVDELWAELASELPRLIGSYRRALSTLEISHKDDKTLLTDADLAVERLIVEKIRQADAHSPIIAEESGHTGAVGDEAEQADRWKRVWVVDPIDGTAEFVRPDRVEFCSVVCLLDAGAPAEALVVAPELGDGRVPLVLTASRSRASITVNGGVVRPATASTPALAASVTRSASNPPRSFETPMLEAGYELKTRTTSQTLDMVRTAVDLRPFAASSPRFDLFLRRDQKLWDGVAGICFGESGGLVQADEEGKSLLPVAVATLQRDMPGFDATLMGRPEAVEWFLEIARR